MASSATDSQSKDKSIREGLVRSGGVDCLISVANNFFYTLSLPCTLWFFDKNKSETIRDKILFIDARNYYTVIDKTLNEWNEWQMRNLNAIVWLYRGEVDKYQALISSYILALNENFHVFDIDAEVSTPADAHNRLADKLADLKSQQKELVAKIKATKKRNEKEPLKNELADLEETIAELSSVVEMAAQFVWLTDKFGDKGTYRDIPGLCRIATIDEVESKQFSLTPGAYTGAEAVKDDGVDFAARMKEIHSELERLQNQSAEIFATIKENESLLWK